MSWKRAAREDEENRQRLRHEAMDSRAEFSEVLHQQVRKAFRACAASPLPMEAEVVPIRRCTHGWLIMAAAASFMITAAVVWQAFRTERGSQPPGELPQVAKAPAASQDQAPQPADVPQGPAPRYPAPGEIVTLVDSTVTSSQWAYLDHDARVALKLFAEVVPFRPSEPCSAR